ncbi:hypothetical protein Hanom_Chr01g00071831 [Helianthus anomalus]
MNRTIVNHSLTICNFQYPKFPICLDAAVDKSLFLSFYMSLLAFEGKAIAATNNGRILSID